ncbi:hypothetical protein [Vibrio phage vB_pir03]|nr:hypothetical protein [Vibrio phage vB_pir03]
MSLLADNKTPSPFREGELIFFSLIGHEDE